MHRPVLVTPATDLPVSVEECARLLNKVAWVDDVAEVEDAENIEFAIRSAVDHYQGWNGVLGISLAQQGWRQDFDRFERELCFLVGPVVADGMSLTWRNAAGQVATVPSTAYALRTDATGRQTVRFDADYQFPTDLHESGAVSITYQAGFEELPHDIKAAIVLRVQLQLDEAATANSQYLERAESNLISKYRRYVA